MKKALSTYWFNFLTSHFLIYNSCWEDPEIDRFLMEFDSESNIFTITSAGDNVLAYLADKPLSIDCVDLNPHQNSLLALKIALFKNASHSALWKYFERGKTSDFKEIYDSVKSELSFESATYWDKHIHWFSPNKGFYTQSLSGKFASVLKLILSFKEIKESTIELLHEPNPENREHIYDHKISPQLWTGLGSKIWKSNLVLSLAGVPSSQKHGVNDLEDFLKTALRNIFVVQNPATNHFWRLYLEGSYGEQYRPTYLELDLFELIKSQTHKVSHSVNSVTNHLENTSKKYSHFILLDHQDWMVTNNTIDLENEWRAILKQAKPEAKVLMRSVHPNLNFLPEFVRNRISEISIDPDYLRTSDRVGTYPSTFLFKLHV